MSPISRPTTDRSPSLELDCDHRTQHQQGRLTGLSGRNVAQPKGKRPGVQSKPPGQLPAQRLAFSSKPCALFAHLHWRIVKIKKVAISQAG